MAAAASALPVVVSFRFRRRVVSPSTIYSLPEEDSTVSMFKLRDMTAAYKELTGDMSLDDGESGAVRVIVDP